MIVRADTVIAQRLVWKCPECGHNNTTDISKEQSQGCCVLCEHQYVLDVYPKADCTGDQPKKKDILERLRSTDWYHTSRGSRMPAPADCELHQEAADEIQRLRMDLDTEREEMDMLRDDIAMGDE